MIAQAAFKLLVWVMLGMFFMPRVNRTWRALSVFLPLAFLQILIIFSNRIPYVMTSGLGDVFTSLSIALTLLWLFAYMMDDCRWYMTLTLAAGTFILTGIYITMSHGMQIIPAITFYTLGSFSILGGLLFSSILMQDKFDFGRFMRWLPIGVMVFSGLAMVFKYSFTKGTAGIDVNLLVQTILSGSVKGLVFYLVLLPYMILTKFNGFYRDRLVMAVSNETEET